MTTSDIAYFLRTYAPDFCWCTYIDLMLMMETETDDCVDEVSFKTVICRLKKEGWFKVKRNEDPSAPTDKAFHPRYLYLRVKHAD